MKFPLSLAGCCVFICATAYTSSTARAGLAIDQSQTTAETFSDLWMGNEDGQTFTVGKNGKLVGLRLLLKAGAGSPGSEFLVTIRKTVDGVPQHEIVAVGGLDRRYVPVGGAGWVSVLLDPPYEATAGEVLAFTIWELAGGGNLGFNEWGNATGNPYSGGRMFLSFTPGEPLAPTGENTDLAFQTVVSDANGGGDESVLPRNADYGRIGALIARIAAQQARIKQLQKLPKTKARKQEIQALRRQVREGFAQIAGERQVD